MSNIFSLPNITESSIPDPKPIPSPSFPVRTKNFIKFDDVCSGQLHSNYHSIFPQPTKPSPSTTTSFHFNNYQPAKQEQPSTTTTSPTTLINDQFGFQSSTIPRSRTSPRYQVQLAVSMLDPVASVPPVPIRTPPLQTPVVSRHPSSPPLNPPPFTFPAAPSAVPLTCRTTTHSRIPTSLGRARFHQHNP